MMATEKQQNYLIILFIDCGFTRQQRNIYLSEEFGREIKGLDELDSGEASKTIRHLLEIKERKTLEQFGSSSIDDEENL